MASCSCWTGCEGRVWGVFDREPSIGVGVVAGGAAGALSAAAISCCVGRHRMEQGAVASAPEGLPRPKLGEEAGPR